MSKKWIAVAALIIILGGAFTFNYISGKKIVEEIESTLNLYGMTTEKISFSRFFNKLSIEGLDIDISEFGVSELTASVKKIEASGFDKDSLDPTTKDEYPTFLDKLLLEGISYRYQDEYMEFAGTEEFIELKGWKQNIGKIIEGYEKDPNGEEFWNAMLSAELEEYKVKNSVMTIDMFSLPTVTMKIDEGISSMDRDLTYDYKLLGASLSIPGIIGVKLDEFTMLDFALPPKEILVQIMDPNNFDYYIIDEIFEFYLDVNFYDELIFAGLEVTTPLMDMGDVVKINKIHHLWPDEEKATIKFSIDSLYLSPTLFSPILSSDYQDMFKHGLLVSATLDVDVKEDDQNIVKFNLTSDQLAHINANFTFYPPSSEEVVEIEEIFGYDPSMDPDFYLEYMKIKRADLVYEDKGLIPLVTLVNFENDYYYETIPAYIAAINDEMTEIIAILPLIYNNEKVGGFLTEIMEGLQAIYSNPGKIELSISAEKPFMLDEIYEESFTDFDAKVAVTPGKIPLLELLPAQYQ